MKTLAIIATLSLLFAWILCYEILRTAERFTTNKAKIELVSLE